ncbi:NUDIX hydrolase [Sphingomonas ginkgonis]|nr:NUDIX domain-containing protein [Sphingomonas ginkgonis]
MAVAVDLVLFTVAEGRLQVLLVRRAAQPARGQFALPGTFVRLRESLDQAAARGFREKAGLSGSVRQFAAFGSLDRDPRMRVVSIGYMALSPRRSVPLSTDRRLVPVVRGVAQDEHGPLTLPFDHAEIIRSAFLHLRADLDHSLWSFGLLEQAFSLRELQEVHEAIREQPLNKPAFRKRLLQSGKLIPTGGSEQGNRFRPAQLYSVNQDWRDEER